MDTGLALRLKHAEHTLRANMQSVLSGEDLLFEHWQVIAALDTNPGLRMSNIAQQAFLPPATLTRHMDRLIERALVVRRIDPEDRRSTIGALSSRGRELASRLRAIETATESELARTGNPQLAICAVITALGSDPASLSG